MTWIFLPVLIIVLRYYRNIFVCFNNILKKNRKMEYIHIFLGGIHKCYRVKWYFQLCIDILQIIEWIVLNISFDLSCTIKIFEIFNIFHSKTPFITPGLFYERYTPQSKVKKKNFFWSNILKNIYLLSKGEIWISSLNSAFCSTSKYEILLFYLKQTMFIFRTKFS